MPNIHSASASDEGSGAAEAVAPSQMPRTYRVVFAVNSGCKGAVHSLELIDSDDTGGYRIAGPKGDGRWTEERRFVATFTQEDIDRADRAALALAKG